jgi:hypothetical protein
MIMLRSGQCGLFVMLGAFAIVFVPQIADAEVRPADIARPAGAQRIGPGYGKAKRQLRVDTRAFMGNVNLGTEDRGQLIISPKVMIAEPRGENEFEFVWGFTNVLGPAALGGAYGRSGLKDRSTFRIGNPALTYFWTWRTLGSQLRLGLGGTLPTAIRRDDKPSQSDFDEYAFAATSLMDGQRDLWLWKFNTMSGIAQFDYLFRHWSGFMAGIRLVAVPMYEAWDRLADSDPEPKDEYANGVVMLPSSEIEFVGQAEIELAFDTRLVRIGVTAAYMHYLTGEGVLAGGCLNPAFVNQGSCEDAGEEWRGDAVGADSELLNQISVEPELRIRLGTVDMLLGMNLPINPPAGFALDPGRFWSARVGFASPTELLLPERPGP